MKVSRERPALLVALRIVQGFAAGGEWGGSALYGMKWAPPCTAWVGGALRRGVGSALGGGLAPAIATALYASSDHASWPVAVYGAVASVMVIARAASPRDTPPARHLPWWRFRQRSRSTTRRAATPSSIGTDIARPGITS
ncbi:hypothetical protein IMZ11_25740 [Microtetraspora sp. AC03309]|uniref:hypothetical protein n=1 Tax=Microtetraspora sp. AC03309 TaxID=2779376 RepID=UPI001E50CD61|nr:hypothetical protein [Microtetraspora sp. AC03309]MCC5579033.1 hypothetical protein [Microtetraspora sp. AC03309]